MNEQDYYRQHIIAVSEDTRVNAAALNAADKESSDVREIAFKLYNRVLSESEKLLAGLGLDIKSKEMGKVLYPADDKKFITFLFKGEPVLTVQATDNMMGIEFIPHKTETQGGSE